MSISIIFNIIVGALGAQMNNPLDAFTVINVRGDGNCAFRALAVALGKNPDVHGEYRTMAVTIINRNQSWKDDIQTALPTLMADPDLNLNLRTGTVEEYLERMAGDAVYAGDIELDALAHHFNIRIQIWQGTTPVFMLNNTGPGAAARPLVNLLRVGAHYKALVPASISGPSPGSRQAKTKSNGRRQPKTKSNGRRQSKTKSNGRKLQPKTKFNVKSNLLRSGPLPMEARPVRNSVMIRPSPVYQKTPDDSLPVRRDAILGDLSHLAPVQRKQTVPIGNHSVASLAGNGAYGTKAIVSFKRPIRYNFLSSFPAGVRVKLQHLPPNKKGEDQFKILAVGDSRYSDWIGCVLKGDDVVREFGLRPSQRAPLFPIGEGVQYNLLRNGRVDAVLEESSDSN